MLQGKGGVAIWHRHCPGDAHSEGRATGADWTQRTASGLQLRGPRVVFPEKGWLRIARLQNANVASVTVCLDDVKTQFTTPDAPFARPSHAMRCNTGYFAISQFLGDAQCQGLPLHTDGAGQTGPAHMALARPGEYRDGASNQCSSRPVQNTAFAVRGSGVKGMP